MNGFDRILDELVGKVMADLRRDASPSAVSPAATVGAALTSDFRAVRAAQTAAASKNVDSEAGSTVVVEKTPGESSSSSAPVETKAVSRESASDADLFDVAERVLVADSVRRLAAGTSAKRWAVRANAVVTPAAFDALRKAGVELVRRESKAVASVGGNVGSVTLSASNVPWSVGGAANRGASWSNESSASSANPNLNPISASVSTTNLPSGASVSAPILLAVKLSSGERVPKFVEDYLARNFEYETLRFDCLKETTKRVGAAIAENKETRVILTTRDAAIASVWANRISGVRAVVAFSAAQAERDLSAANANVVIVDPSDVGPYPFRRIVEFFLTRSRRAGETR